MTLIQLIHISYICESKAVIFFEFINRIAQLNISRQVIPHLWSFYTNTFSFFSSPTKTYFEIAIFHML